jgi:malonyl-CoA decarboxylase
MRPLRRDSAFLADLLQTIAERSRQLLGRRGLVVADLPFAELARLLISTRGEASGVALARRMLEKWEQMDAAERLQWFKLVAVEFGPDPARLKGAVEAWTATPGPQQAQDLHLAAEPLRQELLRRINLAPGGTATLVSMREELLLHLPAHPELAAIDADFAHLFNSWFNRGFLVLRRIDWSSPADVLEKIIRYEAVHEIRGWDDLRRRLQPPDRRCFAFFHPQMPDEPLIFVEVALTRGTPSDIAALLSEDREPLPIEEADTAVFYSISNTQAGLKGVSFGNFLIKQVVEELAREAPNLKTFVTLSPVPGFAAWLATEAEDGSGRLGDVDMSLARDILARSNWHFDRESRTAVEPVLMNVAARYLVLTKGANGKPADPVARFHLGNGASLHRINAWADLSPNGLRQSHGVMVNYLYDPNSIERNHEAFANTGEIACSAAVRRLIATERRARARPTAQADSARG